MRQVFPGGLIVGCSLLFASVGCSDDPSTDGSGAASGTGGSAGSGNTASGGEGGLGIGGNPGEGGAPGDCAAKESFTAEPVPLDMYIMLDRSGSMAFPTGVAGTNRWEAVGAALDGFFAAPESSDLGIALKFFPAKQAGVPDSCGSSIDCSPSGGLCAAKLCEAAGFLGAFILCDSDVDCGADGPCVVLGNCSTEPFLCGVGSSLPFCSGVCEPLPVPQCDGGLTCAAGDYAAPTVPMGALPAHATALSGAIASTGPWGGTPTAPALQGAIDFAVARKMANPLHQVVAVLATDGVPTDCSPIDTPSITSLAAGAFNGSPSVATFVVGVIPPEDPTGQSTMDAIAAAGGTTEAFIVDPNGNLTQGFVDALSAIRGSALACDYFIPDPGAPNTVDYDRVNVEHTPSGLSPGIIPFVGDVAGCDPTEGGWYYDVDPDVAEPTKILMCPASCSVLEQGGALGITVGCETVVAVAK